MSAPTLNYSLLAPILVILGGAVIGVLIEAFAKSSSRAALQKTVAFGSIIDCNISFGLRRLPTSSSPGPTLSVAFAG